MIDLNQSSHIAYLHVYMYVVLCLKDLVFLPWLPCKLKRRLDSAAGMIDSYEQAWEEKNKELQKHKVSMIAVICNPP